MRRMGGHDTGRGPTLDHRRAEDRQLRRRHLVVIARRPSLPQPRARAVPGARYNVATTNYLPRSCQHLVALHPALVILDLALGEVAGWDLLERLRDEALTAELPVIVVSTDRRLLDHARADPALYAGRRRIAMPCDLDDPLGAVRALIGPADRGGWMRRDVSIDDASRRPVAAWGRGAPRAGHGHRCRRRAPTSCVA